MNVDNKSGSLLANTGNSEYMVEPLIMLQQASSEMLAGDQDLSQTSSVLPIKGRLDKWSLCLFQN